MEDDNKLVTLEQLSKEHDNNIKTIWDNEEIINELNSQMEMLSKVKFTPYSTDVLNAAKNEILGCLGWTTKENFEGVILKILKGEKIPLSLRTKDKTTSNLDFWLQRCVFDTSKDQFYNVNDVQYSKSDVLLSKQFSDFLKKYIKEEFGDRVQFWCFSGSIISGEQILDVSKFSKEDIKYIQRICEKEDFNPKSLIMFQFKKKIPEVIFKKQ